MFVPQVNESEHLISWEMWYHRLTDQPPAYPGPTIAIADGRAGGLDDGEADWSTAPV